MRVRRQTVEHPFGTIKSWMGATHFQMRTLKNVSPEMALHVLAYKMKRVMRIREDKILVDVSDVTLVRFKGVFGFKGVEDAWMVSSGDGRSYCLSGPYRGSFSR